MASTELRRHLRDYLTLVWPIFINLVSFALISIGDSIMVSWLEGPTTPPFTTAASFASQVCSIPILFSIGFSAVLAPLVARSTRTQNYDKPAQALKYILSVTTTIGALLAGFLILRPHWTQHLKQPDAVVKILPSYLSILAVSVIFSTFTQPLRRYLEGLGWVRTNMLLTFFGGFLNLGLNYLLMYGVRPLCPPLGFEGIAIATLITRITVSLIYLGYALWLHKHGYLPTQGHRRITFSTLVALALPGGLELGLRAAYIFLVGTLLTGWIGFSEQKIGILLFRTLHHLLLLPLAINITSSILVARASKRKEASLHQYHIGLVGYSLATPAILLLSLLLPASLRYMLYCLKYDEETLIQASKLLWSARCLLFLSALHIVGVGLLRGLRDTVAPFFITLAVYAFIGLPLAYTLGLGLEQGISGILIGTNCSLAALAILLFYRFYTKTNTSSPPPAGTTPPSEPPTTALEA